MNSQDQRDQLIERAKYGEISGTDADAEAIRLGLGSLSSMPSETEFRPEEVTHWTIPMAVAWIAYLELDEVREWSEPCRDACTDWIWRRWRIGFDGPVHEGWFLEQRSKPTLALLSISSAFDRSDGGRLMSMTVAEAREALWAALREGFFPASGIDLEAGRRVEVPALEWHELVPVEGRGQVDEVRRGLLGTGYREVLIPSVALRGIWRRPNVSTVKLPPLLRPTGHGYMPIFCAAQWIATDGGRRDFDPTESEVWRPAYDALLAAVSSEKVRVLGVKDGHTEPVPSHLFAGIRVDYPFVETSLALLLSNDLIIRSYPYVDDEHWRNGFDDALVDRKGDKWKRLMVEKGDVRSIWPFEEGPGDGLDQRTGLPGRPAKSRQFLDDEFRRRAEAGELAGTLVEEAEALLRWLANTHKALPRPTQTTVENNIRAEFRRMKSTK